MADELTLSGGGIVALETEKGLAEMIKPLQKEIHLFDTYVAGTSYLKDKDVLDTIKVNDRLTLQREKNKFDENAIRILTADGEKLGYVPEKDNIVFSRLMDAGKLLIARIKNIEEKGTFTRIRIGICLVDF